MAELMDSPKGVARWFVGWLLEAQVGRKKGPHEEGDHVRQQPWWKVTCLTGVDYFSTLG